MYSRDCEPIALHRWDVMDREFECSREHSRDKVVSDDLINFSEMCRDVRDCTHAERKLVSKSGDKTCVSCLRLDFANLSEQAEFLAEVGDLFHGVFVSKLC